MRTVFYILSVFVFASCSRSILLEDIKLNGYYYSISGTPGRNLYFNTEVGDSFKVKWISEINGSTGSTSFTIFGENLFVPDLSGRIYCINPETGQEVGVEKYKGQILHPPVFYKLRMIYTVNSFNGGGAVLVFYDYFEGKIVNEVRIPGYLETELLQLPEGLVLITRNGSIIKYSYGGDIIWRYDSGVLSQSPPSLHENLILSGNKDGELIALNNETGELVYRKILGSAIRSAVVIHQNTAYCCDSKGAVYSIDPMTGQVSWIYDSKGEIRCSPTVGDECLYVGNLKGDLFAVERTTGRLKWKLETGGLINTPGVLFEDYLVQPDNNRKVFVIDPGSGRIVRKLEYESRVRMIPHKYGKMLFIGIDKGQVIAYELR